MTRTFMMVMAVVAVTMLSLAASAGTISGKISGVSGESVVYVEAPAGKTSRPHPGARDRPEGLMFQPHITAVQVGTTVQFLNSDNVAHNVFWSSSRQQEAHPQPGHLAEGDKRPSNSTILAVPLLCNVHPRWLAMLWSRQLRTSQ